MSYRQTAILIIVISPLKGQVAFLGTIKSGKLYELTFHRISSFRRNGEENRVFSSPYINAIPGFKESYDKRTRVRTGVERGINLVASGGISRIRGGVYKCDCGWQLLGTVIWGREGKGGRSASENVTRSLARSLAPARGDVRRLLYFFGILPEGDADVTSRAGVLSPRTRARAFSSVENYCLLYAGRARAKSDLVNDAGIVAMANERIENSVVPAYRSVVTWENLPCRRDDALERN